jgi:acetyl-CoA decarbonylase/synthase complex subunit gamma
LKQKFKPFGYPTITFPADGDADQEMVTAGIHMMKYGGLIMLNDLDPARIMPLVVLGQNIYTDPQKPMQMSQGVYPIGDPGEDSPVLITTNFSLTYFIVSGEIEASRIPTWLLVMDVEGLSVLTAWAAGKFVPEKIAQFIGKSEIADKVKHKDLILPGYVSQISGELEEEMSGWKVIVGPREAGDLPHYLKSLAS